MNEDDEKVESSEWRQWIWLGGFASLALIYFILGFFDDFTELYPSHDTVLNACFALGGLAALLAAGFAIFALTKAKATIWQRVMVPFACLLGFFVVVFLGSSRIATVVEGMIDFPAATTRSFPGLLLISRAYQTHGKGRSCDIQTMPFWSDLNISEDDYRFMQAHRRPGDEGKNPDEISSKGYFCARVTLQRSGTALRIMHAGSQTLPQGTVVICPAGKVAPGF